MSLFNIYQENKSDTLVKDDQNLGFKGIQVISSIEVEDDDASNEEKLNEIYNKLRLPSEYVVEEIEFENKIKFETKILKQLGLLLEFVIQEEMLSAYYEKLILCIIPYQLYYNDLKVREITEKIIQRVPDFEKETKSPLVIMSLLNNYIRTQFENKKEIQGIFENKETLIQQSRDFDNLIWKEDLRYYFVYKWILKQDLYIADNIHLIIPPSLVLLQDMNLTIRTWGIDSINLLFKNKNLALLKSRGLQDVYLNVLVNNVLFINSDKKDNSNYAMDTMLSIFDKMYNNEDNEYYNKLYDYIITTILTRGNSVEANLIENNRFVLSYLNKVIDRMGITVYALLEKFINISLKNVKLPWIRKGNFITEIPTLACNNLIKLIKLCPNRIIDYAPEILTGIAQCILNFKDYKVDDDFFNLLINTTEITYNHSNTLQFKADLNALKQADDEVFGRFIDKVLANIEQ